MNSYLGYLYSIINYAHSAYRAKILSVAGSVELTLDASTKSEAELEVRKLIKELHGSK